MGLSGFAKLGFEELFNLIHAVFASTFCDLLFEWSCGTGFK